MSEWIKCTDRKPNPQQTVLVFCAGNRVTEIHIAEYRPDSLCYYWDCDTFGMEANEVEYWMPLPEAPLR